MALPALNNANSISNLPIEANTISEAVLTAASRTGHLQIYNNGSISFNNNISGGNAPTASRESGGLGYAGLSILSEIRNYLESINSNITRFIETTQKQTEITQNLLEASDSKRDIELKRTTVQEKGTDFKETFKDFFDNMKESFSNMAGGGLFGGILSSIGSFLLKGFGAVFAAYLVSKGISKIPIGGGKTVGDKIDELTTSLQEQFGDFASSGNSTTTDTTIEAERGGEGEPATSPQGTPGTNSPSGSATQASEKSKQSNRSATPIRSLPQPKRDSSGKIQGLNFAHPWQKGIKDQIAGLVLELQKRLGRKFLIQSGLRSKEENSKVRGKKDSAHLRGNAVDLYWEGGGQLSDQDFLKIIPIASALGVLGIGVYPNYRFIHLDIDKNGRRAWGPNGSRTSIPKWAEEAIRKHERNEYATEEYTLNDKTEEDVKEIEPSSPSDTTSPNLKSEKENEVSSPTSSMENSASQQKESTANRIPTENVRRNEEEEEEEEEETSEKALKEPQSTVKTATKQTKQKSKRFTSYRIAVYDAFKSAGFSDMQARALTAEVGRENDYKPENLFGQHKDITGPTNFGLISFEGSRLTAVKNKLKSKGLLENNGTAKQTQESLNVMASYVMEEMKTTEAAHGGKEFLSNPNISQEEAEPVLAKYIRWKYKEKGFPWQKHIARERKHRKTLEKELSTGTPEATPDYSEGQSGKPIEQEIKEKVEDVFEWSKEKLDQLKKDFGPNRDTLNKALSIGINQVYDFMGVDPSKKVKIEDRKVVPYEQKNTKGALSTLIDSVNVTKTGETMYESSVGVKSGEQQLTQNKIDPSKFQSPATSNMGPQVTRRMDNPNGVTAAVPPVRQKTESTFEEIQYRNVKRTGVV